jgi:Spy/CpxP family protein refolding chaperone
MTRKVASAIAIVLILIGGVAFSSHAQKETKGSMFHAKKGDSKKTKYPHKPMFSLEALKDVLDLNDKQLASMRALRLDYQKGSIMKEAEIRIAELELMELLNQKTIDLPAIQAKLQQMGSLRTDLSFFRIEKLSEAQTFLNAEQFDKFKTYSMKRSRQHMGKSMSSQTMSPHPMGMSDMMDSGMMEMEGSHAEY